MAYIQNSKIPTPQKFDFCLSNFSGGLNNKSSDTEVAPNQASDLLNMAFVEDGLMAKRHGVSDILTESFVKPIIHFDKFSPINQVESLMCATDDSLYLIDRESTDVTFDDEGYFESGTFDGTEIVNNTIRTKDTGLKVTDIVFENNSVEYIFDEPTNIYDFSIYCHGVSFPPSPSSGWRDAEKYIEFFDENNNLVFYYRVFAGSYNGSNTWGIREGREFFVKQGGSFTKVMDNSWSMSTSYQGLITRYDLTGNYGLINIKQTLSNSSFSWGGELEKGVENEIYDDDNTVYSKKSQKDSYTSSSIKPNIKKIVIRLDGWIIDATGKTRDLLFINKQRNVSTWTSPTIELPIFGHESSLAWKNNITGSIQSGEYLEMFARVRGSDNGNDWGYWQYVSVSKSKIMAKKYLQVEFTFITNNSQRLHYIEEFTIKCYGINAKYNKHILKETKEHVSGTNYIGKYYFLDGESYNMYDGNDVYRVVEPPEDFTPAPSPATIGKYKLKTKLSQSEFDDLYTDQEKALYDTILTNQEENEVWYEPCKQEVDDNFKGANIHPNNAKYIITHKDRVYVVGDIENPHAIYVSDLNNPMYFPTFMGLQLEPNGEKINGILSAFDTVLVSRPNDIHVIYGNTNRTDTDAYFLIRKVNTHTGFANNDVAKVVHNHIFYLGNDGIVYQMHTTQTDVYLLSTKILSQTIDLFLKPINMTTHDLYDATAIFYNDEYFLNIGDKTLVYSYRYMAWTLYDNINGSSFVIYNNVLFIGNQYGKILNFNDEYNDDGEPIVCYWKSKRFDMDTPSNYKQFREIFVVAHVYDDYTSEIKIEFEIDYYSIIETEIIKSQISKWDEAQFGDQWVEHNILASYPLIIGQRGRVIKFVFGNDKLNQPMMIYEINCEYEMKGKR